MIVVERLDRTKKCVEMVVEWVDEEVDPWKAQRNEDGMRRRNAHCQCAQSTNGLRAICKGTGAGP